MANNNGRLEGKVALITGTGSGQGQAAALKFAREGALVVGCDLNEEGSRETMGLVEAAGLTMTSMSPVDLGDPRQAQEWVEAAAAVHGRIDVLYNNAAGPKFGPLPDLSVEDWDFGIRNELSLVFYVTKFAWPYLAERGGVVVNTASTSAHVSTPKMGFAAHCAAKGGVVALTKVIADDGAPFGIRAVSISPGPIRSPELERNYLSKVEGAEELVVAQLFSKRLGEPEDIANAAAFVASDEAGYITGVDFIVDGGMTAV